MSSPKEEWTEAAEKFKHIDATSAGYEYIESEAEDLRKAFTAATNYIAQLEAPQPLIELSDEFGSARVELSRAAVTRLLQHVLWVADDHRLAQAGDNEHSMRADLDNLMEYVQYKAPRRTPAVPPEPEKEDK